MCQVVYQKLLEVVTSNAVSMYFNVPHHYTGTCNACTKWHQTSKDVSTTVCQLNSYGSGTNEIAYNGIRLENKVVLTNLVEAHGIGRVGRS